MPRRFRSATSARPSEQLRSAQGRERGSRFGRLEQRAEHASARFVVCALSEPQRLTQGVARVVEAAHAPTLGGVQNPQTRVRTCQKARLAQQHERLARIASASLATRLIDLLLERIGGGSRLNRGISALGHRGRRHARYVPDAPLDEQVLRSTA